MTEFREKYINPNTEIAKFTKEEYMHYEYSLKHYRDLKNLLDTSKEEGRIEEKKEISKNMLLDNEPIKKIVTHFTHSPLERGRGVFFFLFKIMNLGTRCNSLNNDLCVLCD
ncbi:MAG TPA: hypothetical protein PK762_00345 [Candidatus Kapabacteria bacterium]|nr:hypothetical protein [Candidatus Kapabacteria bacterium]